MVSNFAVVLGLALPLHYSSVEAHNFGSHGLGLADPTGPPILPEITGPFEITVDARFEATAPISCNWYSVCSGLQWQPIFEYSNTAYTLLLTVYYTNVIYFGQRADTNDITLRVDNGSVFDLTASNAITDGTLSTWTVGVDATGYAYIKKDGQLLKSETNANLIPANTNRGNKLLGEARDFGGGLFPLLEADNGELKGLVSGFSLKSLSQPTNIHDQMKFMNLPGHPMNGGFVISFWARFDSTSRSSQRLFEFSNVAGITDIIACELLTSRMRLEIHSSSGQLYALESSLFSVSTGWAYWHVGMTDGGQMFIVRNGLNLRTATYGTSALPAPGIRQSIVFGSSASSPKFVDGVILGLRLDQYHTS